MDDMTNKRKEDQRKMRPSGWAHKILSMDQQRTGRHGQGNGIHVFQFPVDVEEHGAGGGKFNLAGAEKFGFRECKDLAHQKAGEQAHQAELV